MRALKFTVFAVLSVPVVTAVAQDEGRVNEILHHAEERARDEANHSFDVGDYPRVIQNQKMRFEIRPFDEQLATDLIWMLGNMENDGDALVYAKRFRALNPDSSASGYPEAQLYNEWRMFARIPALLEPDILKSPAPHRNTFTLLSAAYRRMGYHADVVRVLDVALKHYPTDEVFIRNRERALALIGG